MKAVESEGISVEEAVNRALLLLGLEPEQVEIAVLRDPAKNGGAETAIVRVQPKETQPKEARPREPKPRGSKPKESARKAKEAAAVERHPVVEAEAESEDVSGETGSLATAEPGDDVPLTDEEGERADRAGDFLEDLFELLDIDCYVEVAADRVDGKVLIDIAGPDTSVIIGRKGAMLDAVELVLNRAMDNVDGGGIRITLDAEGYRERRAEKLRSVAIEQASKVNQTRRPVSLEPMSARERRIVHMALKSHESVTTRSEGEGPERHVIIEPTGERARR